MTRNSPARAEGEANGGREPQDARLAALLPGGEPVESLLRRAQFFVAGGTPSAADLPRGCTGGAGGARRSSTRSGGGMTEGGPLDARGELHRVVLVEGVCQGRDHHLGDPADRLPVDGPGPAGIRSRAAARGGRRSPGTPTSPSRLPVRARGALLEMWRARRGPGWVTRCRVGGDHRGSASARRGTSRPGDGRSRPSHWAGGQRADRRRARAHDRGLRAGPGRRASRRSRRCRRSPTRRVSGSCR